MENHGSLNGFKRFIDAYEAVVKPYCQEIGISPQAFEILLGIAKRKGITTAQEVCKMQNIKPTLMSFHIEKLVQAGYVERKDIDGNRRSINLVCTEKAEPVVKKGAELYDKYNRMIWSGVSDEEKAQLFATLAKIRQNADNIIGGEN